MSTATLEPKPAAKPRQTTRDLLADFQRAGFTYTANVTQLKAIPAATKATGVGIPNARWSKATTASSPTEKNASRLVQRASPDGMSLARKFMIASKIALWWSDFHRWPTLQSSS